MDIASPLFKILIFWDTEIENFIQNTGNNKYEELHL